MTEKNNENNLLDFCRVKKIDERGFGFLKSLYFPEDVFFHFSKIKNEVFKDKLDKLVRGDFFLFFTSKSFDGKRKVDRVWYSIEEVPEAFLDSLKIKIYEEFDDGKTNLFDLISVFNELKRIDAISAEEVEKVLLSKRIMKNPLAIIDYLNDAERQKLSEILEIDKIIAQNRQKEFYWFEDVSKKLTNTKSKILIS